jgi:D-glycero-alpha-D-manno-heptose 1-phosphate guanylyltransferase
MITEAIILAGGLGTRLRSVVSDLPKCMAPVNGKPFIAYVIDHLQQQGIEKLILSVGYKHETIVEFVNAQYSRVNVLYSIEEEPLGTGGAIKLSFGLAAEENVVVTNGDTLYKINLQQLSSFHQQYNADCTLSLKPMKDFDRYGVVELNNDQSIASFKEKQFYAEGLINGGIYAINKNKFLQKELPKKFSFEKDYLETLYNKRKMYGIVQDEYFIDIGIPEDYEKAQAEL